VSFLSCSEKWDVFLEKASEAGAIDNGTVAQDASQAGGLWRIRESITESLGKNGVVYKYDLSLPVVHLYKLVQETQERIGKPETRSLMEGDPWYAPSCAA
jgi:FAD/FMN-containing dehydrogenase